MYIDLSGHIASCVLFYIMPSLFQESTIHGIRYFVDGENAFHRFVWFIIMGFSVGGLSYLVFNSYMLVLARNSYIMYKLIYKM